MADGIRATPRQNQILGLLADRLKQAQQFGAKPFGYENPPVEMLMGLLGVPAVQQTLERMSYGEPLTTGRDMTTQVRPEAMEAAMTLLPMAAGAAKATKGLPVGASIKNVSKIDQATGLPLNSDGTVTLFHHTNKTAAEQIQKTGKLKSAGEPSVYLTTQKTPDTGYGDVVVPIRVKPSLLNLDDEFPDGRMDFSIDAGRPKGSVAVIVEPNYQQGLLGPRIPSPQSLTMPSVPTVEQMQQYGRTEVVPLSQAVSFQSARNWDKFNSGKGPGDLVEGFGDKPLALRLETGEYVIYDGNHRTDLALQKGLTELPMNVIDVKSYDPAHAGRKPVPPSMSDDELLRSLLD